MLFVCKNNKKTNKNVKKMFNCNLVSSKIAEFLSDKLARILIN